MCIAPMKQVQGLGSLNPAGRSDTIRAFSVEIEFTLLRDRIVDVHDDTTRLVP